MSRSAARSRARFSSARARAMSRRPAASRLAQERPAPRREPARPGGVRRPPRTTAAAGRAAAHGRAPLARRRRAVTREPEAGGADQRVAGGRAGVGRSRSSSTPCRHSLHDVDTDRKTDDACPCQYCGKPPCQRMESSMLLAAENNYPLLEVIWTIIVFFAWVIWIWTVISILSDVFRRQDIGGWGKAGWTFLIILVPFLGVLIYLISQGKGMAERNVEMHAGEAADVSSSTSARSRERRRRGRRDRQRQGAPRERRHHPGGVRAAQAEGAGVARDLPTCSPGRRNASTGSAQQSVSATPAAPSSRDVDEAGALIWRPQRQPRLAPAPPSCPAKDDPRAPGLVRRDRLISQLAGHRRRAGADAGRAGGLREVDDPRRLDASRTSVRPRG